MVVALSEKGKSGEIRETARWNNGPVSVVAVTVLHFPDCIGRATSKVRLALVATGQGLLERLS